MRTKLISAPYTIWMTLFIIVPMGLVAFFAFTDKSGAFTLDNIARVGQYSNVFLRSIWLGALATFISLLLGYPLAYTIAKAAPNRQSFLILLIMLPMWMNFLLRTYAWMSLLEDNGLINNMLAAVGLPRIHMINTAGAVVLGMVYNYIPYMILPIYSVLTKIDNSVIEAAQDLGANNRNIWCSCPLFPHLLSLKCSAAAETCSSATSSICSSSARRITRTSALPFHLSSWSSSSSAWAS